jgi:hypothetical protein
VAGILIGRAILGVSDAIRESRERRRLEQQACVRRLRAADGLW